MPESLLKANFQPAKAVEAEAPKTDPQAAYQKKAIESIGGSMVFVERRELYWDGGDIGGADA